MIKQENIGSNLASNKQTIIFCIILSALLITTVSDFGRFLVELKSANPYALALLMIIMGLSFAILHNIGFDFSYKEEVEFQDNIPRALNPHS